MFMKRFKLLAISIMFIVVLTSYVYGDWVQEGDIKKYEENGVFKVNDWLTNQEGNYYFDANGIMVTGLFKIGKYYYAFHNTGKAYRRDETFTYNGIQYEIGGKGKVKDLEFDLNDEAYKTYIENLAIEKANKKAFAESQNAINESIAQENAQREAEEKAIRESMQAESAAAQAIIDESKKAWQQYLLSDEDYKKITEAVNRGNTSKSAIQNMIIEMRGQLERRRVELVAKAKELRAVNPLANLGSIMYEYDSIIVEYADSASRILSAIQNKYSVNNKQLEKFDEEIGTFLEEMKTKFDVSLEKDLG